MILPSANQQFVYLSIDPGTTGGIALVHGGTAAVFDVPTYTEKTQDGGNRTHVDLPALFALVRGLAAVADIAVIERVGGRKGDQAFTLGILMYAAGALAMACAAAGLPIRFADPNQWKRQMGLKGGRKNKDQSLVLAAKLFPSLAKSLKRVKDHNRAEAALLGEWARRHGIN